MVLADKIIQLRKREGWSQEDLAGRLDVSRQSVSKWESRASVPELDKILAMSDIFGVTTDYLLRDDMDEADPAGTGEGEAPSEDRGAAFASAETEEKKPARYIALHEALSFMKLREKCAVLFALATALCILSPITLLALGVRAEYGGGLPEAQAAAIGLAVLFVMVAGAVAVFITMNLRSKSFEFIEKEDFKLTDDVYRLVEEKYKAFEKSYAISIAAGVCIIILGVIPLFVMGAMEDEILMVDAVCILLAAASVGVFLIVWASTRRNCYVSLMQIEDYSPKNKKVNEQVEKVGSIYWLIVTAGYLCYSFITDDWGRSWIVWPVAGVLFGVISSAMGIHEKEKK